MYKKEPSHLETLTEALVSATNLQRVLDAPRNAKMNNLGAQYQQLETAFGLAQNADDIANLNNKLNNLNKQNIYAETSTYKDIANMHHRNKAEEYRTFEDSYKQISTIISNTDFPQTQEDYRATMSDWAEVYQQENPNDKRPVMKSLFKKYKEFEKAMSGIMAQDANGNWSLINPNFKYNKSGSGLKDNQMLEQFVKHGQRLENYLGFALADDTITDMELMAGMEEEFESWYYDETDKIKKQSNKDINYNLKQIDALRKWHSKEEPEDEFKASLGEQMSETEIGESLGITDDMDELSVKEKITNQIQYYEWAIKNSQEQVYKWTGVPIEEYKTPTPAAYGDEQFKVPQDIMDSLDLDDDDKEQAFFDERNMQDIQEKVNANINAQEAGEDLPFPQYSTNLEETIKNEYDTYNFTNNNVVDENTTFGQFLTKYLPFTGETEPSTEIAKSGLFGTMIVNNISDAANWNKEPNVFKFAGEELTNSTKDLIENKIPLYDANGNFNPKFAEKVPKINVLFDSRTKKWATLPDGSLYIMDSQRIPPKSVLRELGIRLPKGISPDAIEGEKFIANAWEKYPHLKVRKVDMKNFGKDYPNINMLESNKGRFKGIQNLSLYGNQYAEGTSPKNWKTKAKGVGKFAKGFVAYNALTALSGAVVEKTTDDETLGEIASQGTAVLLDAAALAKPKFLKQYRKTVNKAFKEVSEKFIQSTEATKATKKKFINMAQKVGKSKTTKFAMAFGKKLSGKTFRNKFLKSVAFKLTGGLLAKVGMSAATLGTIGTVAAVAWTAYDVYELSHMIYEAYVEVEGEQGALEEWNKAVN